MRSEDANGKLFADKARSSGRGAQFQYLRVVVALYNGSATINEQLDALSRQSFTGNWEVVVVDNGSVDDGPVLVEHHPLERMSLIRAPWERGQAFARNIGAFAKVGEAVPEGLLFCDQDDVVDDDWVAAMARGLHQFDILGGSYELYRLNGNRSQWRPCPMRADIMNCPLPFTSGSNLAIRASVFSGIGGFRTGYRGGGEDADLCWRAQLAGYSLGYAPDAIVAYRFRHRLRDHLRQQSGYGRSSVQLAARFPELEHVRPPGPAREIAWLTSRFPLLLSPGGRGRWLGSAGYWWGARREMKSGLKNAQRLHNG